MQEINVTIQETTNETILKFNCNKLLIQGGSYEFSNIDEAKNSPLAQQLFYLPFVKKVYLTANFVAIQRYDIVAWEDVQEEVRSQIEEYLKAGNIVVNESVASTKKEPIEVYAESTPNPAVMKFGVNKVLTEGQVEFKNIDEANQASPMATALFNFPFVKEIFISDNYISITKYDMVEWNDIFSEVRSFIREYLQENKTVLTKNTPVKKEQELPKAGQNVVLEGTSSKIVEILDEYIKPAVASDGGNIAFQSYDEDKKVVSVILQGACSGCPSSTATLKNGIENLLKEMLPNQINEVVAING